MSIRVKFTVIFLFIVIIPLMVVTILSYNNGKLSLRQETLNKMSLFLQAKQGEITQYLEGKRGRTIDFASDGYLRDEVVRINNSASYEDKLKESTLLNKHLIFNKMPLDPDILEIRVINLEGKIIASTFPTYLGMDISKDRNYFRKGLIKTYIEDAGSYTIYDDNGEIKVIGVIAVSTPIKAKFSNKNIGVLVNFYSLENIEKVLLRESYKGKKRKTTREVFLINSLGQIITPTYKIKNFQPIKFKLNTWPVEAALKQGKEVEGWWQDIRGKKVLGASIILPLEENFFWLLITEQDADEVLAPVSRLRKLSVFIGLITFFVVFFLALLTAHSFVTPITKLEEAAIRIAKGEYKKIEVTSSDEIGKLAESFNKMVESRHEYEEQLKAQRNFLKRTNEKLHYEICERLRAEAQLRKLTRAVEQSPSCVLITDTRGIIEYVNPKFTEITGYSLEEARGRNPRILKSGKQSKEVYDELWNNLREGKPWRGELHNRKKNGELYWAYASISPIKNSQGVITHFVAVEEDITEKKKAEEKIKRTAEELARSNKDLEQFAYVASHDLQEPLRMVASYLQLLERRYKDNLDSDAKEFIGYAVGGAKRMQKMINDLLAYSRVSTRGEKFKMVDCAGIIDLVLSDLQMAIREKGVDIIVDPLPEIYADPAQIEQVFRNLISNAIKFSSHQDPKIHIGAKKMPQEWIFFVKDNGIGIAKEYWERIFIIFQKLHPQEEYPGTGIGLAICKRIVERHKGKIWVESEEGKGSTFYFSIPLHKLSEEKEV